jgi:hypothetical protein
MNTETHKVEKSIVLNIDNITNTINKFKDSIEKINSHIIAQNKAEKQDKHYEDLLKMMRTYDKEIMESPINM